MCKICKQPGVLHRSREQGPGLLSGSECIDAELLQASQGADYLFYGELQLPALGCLRLATLVMQKKGERRQLQQCADHPAGVEELMLRRTHQDAHRFML
jgi:hypothetical protein